MGKGRQIAYYTGGIQSTPEVVVDMFEEEHVPAKDEVIERGGKRCRVEDVITESSLSASGSVPVIRVFLVPA